MAIIIGKDSDNNLIGTNRDDWVFGLGGNDTLSGGDGSDKLFGGNGNDSIAGGAGNDWIFGGSGNDSLIGGSGADLLTGGSGQDHFVYQTATDSPAAAGWDRILDFTQGQDKIDLAAFRNSSSNLDLIWKGEDPAVPGAWGVWYHNGSTSTCVYADTNGDGIADLKIELKNTCGLNLVASDFIGVAEVLVNVAPLLDLDANNSAAAGANYATTFTENGAPVAIADADVGITDVDDTHIVSASITLTNPKTGDSLVAGALPTGITVGGGSTATHIILTGSATLADYQAALKAITFSNSSENPDTTARDVTVVVNDGDANSNTAHTTITVVAVNDAPTSTDGSETTTEDTPVTLGLDDFGSYSDVEGPAIAAVKITTLASNGRLEYDTGGSTWAAVILDQEFSATDINAGGLRFVPDANENGTPYTTVGFRVGDGTDFSTSAYTLTLNVTAANDAPVATDDVLSSVAEDSGTRTITFAELTGNDSDGDAEVAQGLIVSAVSNAVGGTVALVGGHVEFTPTADFNGVASFDYTVQDDGTTNGAPDAKTDIGRASFTVTAFNDPPTVAGLVVTETSISFVASDVDNATLSLASPFATAFGNPTITSDAITALTPAQQAAAVSGTLQVTDGTATANVVRLYLGTNGNDLATLPLAGSPTAIYGFAGADSLAGGTGADSLYGGTGNDLLDGGGTLDTGNDTLLGGLGNDALFQTKGNDSIDGGGDFDTLLFNDGVGGGVNVNLATHVSTHGANVATVTAIENVTGTAGDDTLTGGDSTHAPDLLGNGVLESFRPLGGNDTITGATGNGFITRADYSTSTSAVAVNLGEGTASDGFGGTDTLVRVDQAFGGSGNDTLLGGSQERSNAGIFLEQFRGGAGNDTIDGAGADTVVGAAGTNQVRYSDSPAAVIVNLGVTDFVAGMVTVQGGTARDGFIADTVTGAQFTDTLLNINSVLGSNFNDTLVGGASDHRLIGGPGNDLLVGGTSGVEASYNNGTTAVNVNLATGFVSDGQGGSDTLVNIDDLRGSIFNDTLTGNAASNRILGDPGADTIDGGDGIDFASYLSTSLANGGINAFIENGAGLVNDGFGLGSDTLSNIEGLIGTHSNDTLAGGLGDQWFIGRGGSDVINGGDGSDGVSYINDPAGVTVNLGAPGSATDGWGGVWGFGGIDTLNSIENVEGSQFNDSITGDANANVIDGGGGNDTLNGGDGDDRIERGSDLGLDRVDGGAGSDTLVLRNTLGVALPPILIEDGATYNARLGLTPASPGFVDPTHIAVSGGFPLGLTVDAVGVEHIEIIGGNAGGTLTINGDFSLTDLEPTTITATGGAGADTLNASGVTSAHRIVANGGGGDDSAIGGAGNDLLNGAAGNDTLDGWEGDDYLLGGDGVDSLLGGAGDDLIASGRGADHVDGGEGIDTLLRRSSTSATTTDLSTGTASGGDTLLNIENVSGSAFSDTMIGSNGANVLSGWEGFDSLTGGNGNDQLLGESGDDTLIGGAGADTLDGGSTPGNPNDTDLVSYFYASSAVTVNLAAGTGAVSGDLADTDTISNIEMVSGSAFADALTGGNTANDDFERFEGRGGNDTINGGSGFDEVFYLSAPGSVTVDLSNGSASDGEGGTDLLSNIEAVRSSNFSDILTGDANNNRFRSQAGSDTIDGGAGIDEADYRSSASVNANLVTGLATDSGGTDMLTSIENLRGSPGNDTFVGNSVANRLRGESGSDTLIGNEGNDTLEGASGDEFLQGGAGNDVINGGENPAGQLGDTDTASFEDAGTGVTVNLALGSATIGAETDTLIDIERVIGTDFADTLIGGDPKHDDTTDSEQFEGRGGADSIDGGSGDDWALYTSAPIGVVVDLAAGSALDGYGTVDTLVNIDRVRGSAFDDQIYGSNSPGGTNERFEGMAGNDIIDGRGGFDYLNYGNSIAGVIVNLDTAAHLVGPDMVLPGTARDGFAFTDTFLNIEGVRGSGFSDTFFGSNNAPGTTEAFEGMGGSDFIDGGGGFDRLEYSQSFGRVTVNLVSGTASDGLGGFDTFINIEGVRGSIFNDSLTGDAGNNTLEGREGGDFLTGGAGNDTLNGGEEPANQLPEEIDVVNYGNTGAATGVTVDLGLGTATDGLGGTDTLIDIENVRGTEFADMLRGGNPTNSFSGTSEQFEGRGGNDTIDGGIGNDWAIYLNAAAGVHVDLAAGLAFNDGDGGVDTLVSIDRVRGSNFDDLIYGSDNPEGTNERFDGRQGHDYIDGRGGLDYAQYNGSSSGVVVDLQLGIATADDGQTDTLVAIEGVRGSNFADLLYGSDNATGFEAFEGLAGNDFIDGRGGVDRVEYVQSDAGVSVNLATGTASDGFGTTDTYVNIEGVRGSRHDDQLTGNSGDNTLEGQEGNDILVGSGGTDTMTGSAGIDTFKFNATSDSSASLSFSDVITDFVHATDKIDLSAIDANTGVDSDQAFAFVALENPNTVANSVTWSEDVANTRTILQIDNNGDTTADMQIVLQGTGLGLTGTDFIL